jgi:hypothetical protein
MKVAGKKKVVATLKSTIAPKAAIVPKGTTAAMLKIVSTLPKAATLVVPSIVGGAAGQKGALGAMKVGVLKIKDRVKRPASTELSLAWTVNSGRLLKLCCLSPPQPKELGPLRHLCTGPMMTESRFVQC